MEIFIRFLGVPCSFMLLGTFCPIPLFVLGFLDTINSNANYLNYQSEKFKRGISWLLLFQSGISVQVENLKYEIFKDYPSVITTFSHASNLDGFLVSGTCPIKQLAFGKKELFMVPFFSWISLAIGGIPVDRAHRDRAIRGKNYYFIVNAKCSLGQTLCLYY